MNQRIESRIESMDLELQIASLRAQLHEAEELRHAISHGQVDAFIVGPTDDSKRVLMLSGAYARYRQLVEEMQQGAVTVGRSGEIMFANQAFAAMLGLAPIDVFRVPLTRYLATSDAGDAAMLLQAHPDKAEIKATLRAPSGRQRPVRIALISASDEFNTLLVTERDEKDEEAGATVDAIRTGAVDALVIGGEQVVMLDSAQRFYQTAVDRMQQGVVIVGAQGAIAYANQRMATLVGMPRERLVGTSLLKLAHTGDEPSLASLLNANHGASAQAEVRLRRADKELVSTLVTVTAIADSQKMCLVSDLSLQKRHEATDERTRKFLAMMAHEFRNILGPIRNAVETLKLRRDLDEDCRKLVDVVDRQSARLVALVEDLRSVNPKE
ncbi:MAG TPA: PAS domain-containing protein [Steroidobacteraceae bacterium]|jgi:PAS domain S-box-containing protein